MIGVDVEVSIKGVWAEPPRSASEAMEREQVQSHLNLLAHRLAEKTQNVVEIRLLNCHIRKREQRAGRVV